MAALSPFIDWQIHPRAHQCAQTQIQFEEGQCVYSILSRKNPKEPWQRQDFSQEGWAKHPKNLEILCQWQSIYRKAPPPPLKPLANANPEALLRELLSQGNSEKYPHCMILALMLERKRKLKMIARKQDVHGTWLVYEHSSSGETWLVPEITPSESQITALQKEIMELLSPV